MANALSGEVALVTGGGSGIGRALVEALVGEGMKVGLLEVSPEKVEELEGLGSDVKAIQGDATGLEDNERALSETIDTFVRLDALVCCAGLWDNQAKMKRLPKEKIEAAFDEIFAVNVKSYVLATKVCQEVLIDSEGCIIYTLSNSAFYPDGGGPLYMASKFAVRGLLTEVAYELAPKVRVNGVAPGGTATGIVGLKSLDQGEEAMLASREMREGLASIAPPDRDSAARSRRGLPLSREQGAISERDRSGHQLRRRTGRARPLEARRPVVMGSRGNSATGQAVRRSRNPWDSI